MFFYTLMAQEALQPDYTFFHKPAWTKDRIKQVDYREYAKQPNKQIYANQIVYAHIINGLTIDSQTFKPLKIVFLLHGLGGDAKNFIRWTSQPLEENVLYIAPQGPHAGPLNFCYSWANISIFELHNPNKERIKQDIQANTPFLHQLIDDVQAQFNVPWENIFLTGFSMGGIQAYDVFIHHHNLKYAAIISGVLDEKVEQQMEESLKEKQKHKTLLSIYSACDEIIPHETSKSSQEKFKSLGGQVLQITTDCSHLDTVHLAYREYIWRWIANPEEFAKTIQKRNEQEEQTS